MKLLQTSTKARQISPPEALLAEIWIQHMGTHTI